MAEDAKKLTAREELEGMIKEMATDRNALKERVEEMEASVKAYREASAKGFVIPDVDGAVAQGGQEFFEGYNLALQGKQLTDKIAREGKYVMPEDKREQLAKFFILSMKSAGGDFGARQKFQSEFKTVIGDTGNTFPLPDILESEILHFERENSVALQYARLWQMTGEKLSIPTETGAVSTAWAAQDTNALAESEPEATEVELSAYELGAYSVVRDMVLADSVSDIVSWLTESLAEAAGQTIDDAVFNGDGGSAYGSCSGLLSAACGYSILMASGSTSFSALTYKHLSDMIAKLDGKKKNGARFYLHGEGLNQVRQLEDSQGRPIFFDGSVGAGMPPTIMGYPYSETMKITGTSAAETAFILFGNLRYFAVGQRINSTKLVIDPYGLFTTNRTRFKLYQRWGLSIGLANGFCRLLTAAT